MYFNGDFKRIAEVDATHLIEKVSNFEENLWHADAERQNRFKAHKSTQTIKLLHDDDFRHTNPTSHKALKELKEDIAPFLQKIVAHFNAQTKYQRLKKKNGKGYFVRIILTRLDVGGEIKPHRDDNFSLARCHRIHLPLITNDKVKFLVGDTKTFLPAGELWEINNRNVHGVQNEGDQPRVHMIMDYVLPGEKVIDGGEELIC